MSSKSLSERIYDRDRADKQRRKIRRNLRQELEALRKALSK